MHHEVLRFDSDASMKDSGKCEYTPGFGGGLIVIVTSRIVDGIIVGGIRICLLHMRGVQQRTPLPHYFFALSFQLGNYSGVIQLVQGGIRI